MNLLTSGLVQELLRSVHSGADAARGMDHSGADAARGDACSLRGLMQPPSSRREASHSLLLLLKELLLVLLGGDNVL